MRTHFVQILMFAAVAKAQMTFEPYVVKAFDGRTAEAELGRLRVADHDQQSKRIEIAFVRLRSRAPEPAPPIVFLMGGAGRGIVMGQVPPFFNLFDKLRELGDVVLLDQRGIGMAKPDFEAVCPASSEAPDIHVLESLERMAKTHLEALRRCHDLVTRNGLDTGAFSNDARAEDLEALRKALGAERLILLAWSGGTEVALQAIRHHGDTVAAAILAGTVGSGDILPLPSTADQALRSLAALLASHPKYRSSPNLFETVKELIARVERNPLSFSLSDNRQIKVGGSVLKMIIQGELSDGRSLPGLPAWIYAVAGGDPKPLQAKVERMYRGIASDALIGVLLGCKSGWSDERLGRVAREARSSVVGDGQPLLPPACAMLGIRPSSREQPRLFSPVRTLFVSGSLDAAAPPFQAEEVRFGFPNSSHLIIKNATHDTLALGVAQTAILIFLSGRDSTASAPAIAVPNFQ